ncbi:hypothetical protein HCU40_18030 [Pseudanabaena biceps]|nr:hypothetical protein [Pseudanabaena biceps]
MKKYSYLAIGLVALSMLSMSACTSSTPVADNATPTPTVATDKTTTPKSTTTPDTKPEQKNDTKVAVDSAAVWQDYKSANGKFSVQMPSKPQEQVQDQTTDVGTIKLNMVIAEASDSGYFIGFADFPSKVANPEDVQKGLTESVKGSVGNIKGTILSEKEYMLGTVPCRDFEANGKVQSTDVLMKGRFCLADNRLYQIFALGAKDKLAVTDVDRFIGSFKIES